ncbi:PREDICTED: chymotrypsin-like elastase family member 2A [Merops nubicus]|uniref:chymotrypsin-like elastase family member 2A n=1 Tax=Merops nubicus TaxID=57421 RepID=UPI0004F038CF|nr:PREDICTED: chymotrypsin-like elastase family member 2A [Merops nubicus]
MPLPEREGEKDLGALVVLGRGPFRLAIRKKFFTGAISGSPLRDALQEDVLTERVIGGHEAKPHSWKWQVSLQTGYAAYPGHYRHICGGTLLTGQWVMTAAHCLTMPPGASYRVVLGEHNLSEVDGAEYSIGVDRIFIHQGWNPKEISHG